jgi:hypothetical protein
MALADAVHRTEIDGLLKKWWQLTNSWRMAVATPSGRAVRAPVPKRKRKVAGRKIAPLICTPAVAPLSDSE